MIGPFRDIRVLEISRGQAARMAGMLLADLGADVLRVLPPGEVTACIAMPAQEVSPETPADLAWDRGKRLMTSEQLAMAPEAADVVLSDAPWEEGAGLAVASARGAGTELIRVWMPPHAPTGRFVDLPDDPVLRSALGGFAAHHPSLHGHPVASVVPTFTAVHAAMGAATAAAALVRARQSPATAGDTVVVSGLHAMAACLCSMAITGLDVTEVYSSGTRIPGAPNFRAYQAADGRWIYLAALSPDFFIRALTVLDRLDVMLLPGVDGEFLNILVPATAAGVNAELEKTFATRRCADWLADLTEAGIPVAPVATRDEWLAGPYHDGLVTLDHPDLGPVTMPGLPLRLSGTPGEIPSLPTERALPPLVPPVPRQPPSARAGAGPAGTGEPAPARAGLWTSGVAAAEAAAAPLPPHGRPLAGLRVVDLSTFLAAPFVSSLLADFGAEVVKAERPGGDPYHVFTASYAAVNQRKTIGSLDVRDPAGRDALLAVIRDADVLVDNMSAAAMERLGLGDADLAAINPALIRCSVSAFGRSGAHADLPGFDPVLQSLSGLAAAQGGADENGENLPVTTSSPVHDVATGVLGALGVLAALFERAGLERAGLERAGLEAAGLERAGLDGAGLDGAGLDGAGLERAGLERADLERADLEAAGLEGAGLEGAGLEGAGLEGAGLEGAGLEAARPEAAGLDGAGLERTGLERAGLEGAGLERVGLERVGLEAAGLEAAGLEAAGLERAGLERAGLEAAGLDGAGPDEAAHERAGGGPGQHVMVSLAASAGFLQMAEMTTFPGRPPVATGGPDYPGPTPTRRLYQAADGWLAVAAITGEQAAGLISLTGTSDPSGLTGPDGLAGALAEVFATRPVDHWLELLSEYAIPACPVIERDKALWDPRLGDVGLMHIVRDPAIGRLRITRAYADWAAPHEDQGDDELPPASAWRQRATATLEATGALSAPFVVVADPSSLLGREPDFGVAAMVARRHGQGARQYGVRLERPGRPGAAGVLDACLGVLLAAHHAGGRRLPGRGRVADDRAAGDHS